MKSIIARRLSEASTYAGLGTIIVNGAHAWATRDPQAIVATLAGILAVLVPEKRNG